MKKLYLAFIILLSILTISMFSCSDNTDGKPYTEPEKLQAPKNLMYEHRVLTWDAVENATEYAVNFENTIYKTTECKFELYFYDDFGTYTVEIMAIDADQDYEDSEWTATTVVLYEIVKQGYDENGFRYTLLEDGSGYEFHRGIATTTLIGVVTIPDYFCDLPVKRIADYAFCNPPPNLPNCFKEKGCNIVTTGVNLPKHLESIGHAAFNGMVRVEEIIIPDTVTEIEASAFGQCSHLKKVTLPKGLKEIPGLCFGDTALSEIALPESLEVIGDYAFKNMYYDQPSIVDHIYSELSSITIPTSVKRIGIRAFSGRENLGTINMVASENIESIAASSFYSTLWYKNQPDGLVTLGDILLIYKGVAGESGIVEIPSNIKRILGEAFARNTTIKKVYIPDGVKFMGEGAFAFCTNLTEVRLPADLEDIPANTFASCALEEISLPETLKTIGENAFMGTNLKKIVIPKQVTTLNSTFKRCESLTEVQLHDGIEYLNADVFLKCQIKEITLPKNLKGLGNGNFSQNYAIESIILPKYLEKLVANTFNYSYNLKSIFFEGTKERFDEIYANPKQEFAKAPLYFYSETEPTEEGPFWHYVDGKPVIWGE